LGDKEVVIIDKEEYVKVNNPRASEGGTQPKYLYIPVNEYLAKKETFTPPSYQKVEPRKRPVSPIQSSPSSPAVGDQFVVSSPKPLSRFKEKGIITHLTIGPSG
jgi:hypothetical protein